MNSRIELGCKMAKKNELMQEILLVMMKYNIKDVSETIDCLTS